jgi:hypothetical protein
MVLGVACGQSNAAIASADLTDRTNRRDRLLASGGRATITPLVSPC